MSDRGTRAPSTTQDLERIETAWRELRRSRTTRSYRDLLFEGLDIRHLDTLDMLCESGPYRMSDLARAMQIDKSTLTRNVERLEKRGLVRRRPVADPGGARAVLVQMTDEGQAIFDKMKRTRFALLTRIMADFSDAELADLADKLDRVVAGIERVISTDAR